jgi:hypothetical protein
VLIEREGRGSKRALAGRQNRENGNLHFKT